MTTNHDYNTPPDGAKDWDVPLNENFEWLDTDIEVRDVETKVGEYEPKQGAKFLGTDTGRVYVGDGSQWLEIASTGPSPELNYVDLAYATVGTMNGGYAVWAGGKQVVAASPHETVVENGGSAEWEAPNVVVGYEENAVGDDVVGATVAGGAYGTTSDQTFDLSNAVDAIMGTVGGGGGNTVSGVGGLVAGGALSTASGTYSTVSGGSDNSVTGDGATVSGGQDNQADGDEAAIGGGYNNAASAQSATVGGGDNNDATGEIATVGGGQGNAAKSQGTTVAGGVRNDATGDYATVPGGALNEASGRLATVGGGDENIATGTHSTVAGGKGNDATASGTTVGGGTENGTSGDDATVGGGTQNQATGKSATVGGGQFNRATGDLSTVPGGDNNRATETGGFAAGRNAHSEAPGSFVWGDSSGSTVESQTDDEFVAQAGGGVVFWSSSDFSSGVKLPAGSGSWSAMSSRAVKSDVSPVEPESVLDRVEDLDVNTWRYDAEDDEIEHMGPMAEDFAESFGLGDDEGRISNVDADGVALAAIQGLAERLERKDDRVDDLETTVEELAETVDEQRRTVEEQTDELAAKDERIDDLEGEVDTLRDELADVKRLLVDAGLA